MSLRLLGKFQQKLSAMLITTADQLPRIKVGPIARLRRLREYQLNAANAAAIRAEPPQGATIEFLGFTSIRMFPIEQCHRVAETLAAPFQLMPDSQEIRTIRDLAAQTYTVSWNLVGVLAHDLKNAPVMFRYSAQPDLPECVDYVFVYVNKHSQTLGSIKIVAYLNASADGLLRSFFETLILPPVVLTDFRPKHVGHSAMRYSADWARVNAARALFQNLRGNVDRIIFKDAAAHRFSLTTTIDCTPAIELFKVSGIKTENQSDWLNETRGWRAGLGLDFDRDFYFGDGIYLGTESWYDVREPVVWPLILTKDLPTDKFFTMPGRHGETDRACHRLDLTAFILASKAYAVSVERKLVDFRRRSQDKRNRIQLASDARLYETILREKFFVSLFRGSIKSMEDEADVFLDSLHYRTAFLPQAVGLGTARTSLFELSKETFERLGTQMAEIEDFFSAVLSARNVGTTFLTALIAIVIAVIALAVSIVGTIHEFKP